MDRLITPAFFLGLLGGVTAGAVFGLDPEVHPVWLGAVGFASGLTAMILTAALFAPRRASAGLYVAWFVTLLVVAIGAGAGSAWLAGSGKAPAAPDVPAGPRRS